MTQEEIERDFTAAGWKIAGRSSRHLLVGKDGDLSILAYDFLARTDDPAFQLADTERGLTRWVRTIPSPRIAAVLLERDGEPPVWKRSGS